MEGGVRVGVVGEIDVELALSLFDFGLDGDPESEFVFVALVGTHDDWEEGIEVVLVVEEGLRLVGGAFLVVVVHAGRLGLVVG